MEARKQPHISTANRADRHPYTRKEKHMTESVPDECYTRRNNVIPFPQTGLANGALAMLQYPMEGRISEPPSSPPLDNCIDDAQNLNQEMAKHRIWCVFDYDENGEPIAKQVSGKTQFALGDNITRAMLESPRRNEFLGKTDSQRDESKPSAPIFEDYSEEWYKRYKANVFEECTKVTTRTNLASLYGYFGELRLDEISVDSVQEYMNTMGQAGACKETISQRRKTLSQILEAAREDGIIPKNPASSKRLRNPGRDGEGIQALTRRQTESLIRVIPTITDEQVRLFVAILLYTGVRREEAMALKWEKIDFDRSTILIDEAVTFPIEKPVLKKPKTKAGRRSVPMPDALAEILKPLRQESGIIIHDERGDYMRKSKIKKLYKRVKMVPGLEHFDCRTMRHTYASRNVEADIPMKIVSQNLGHSDIQVTMNIYAQPDMEYKIENRNKPFEYALKNTL